MQQEWSPTARTAGPFRRSREEERRRPWARRPGRKVVTPAGRVRHHTTTMPPTRRALLKLAPVVALGAFAVPGLRDRLLTAGVGFSDWASEVTFRPAHLAPTYRDDEAVPLERFPYNGYDILEPTIDFAAWRLEVSGRVRRPGPYTLEQIQALPKVTQNTRHCCVEGWDVI